MSYIPPHARLSTPLALELAEKEHHFKRTGSTAHKDLLPDVTFGPPSPPDIVAGVAHHHLHHPSATLPHATVDLSHAAMYSKEGANEGFTRSFEAVLPSLKDAKTSCLFRETLRKFLIDYTFDFHMGEDKKTPKVMLNLWSDLREQPLSYLKKKYFTPHHTSDHKDSPPTHAFALKLFDIFNGSCPELDISPLIERETEEIIEEIRERQCSNDVIKKDELIRLLIYQKRLWLKKCNRNLNPHVIS